MKNDKWKLTEKTNKQKKHSNSFLYNSHETIHYPISKKLLKCNIPWKNNNKDTQSQAYLQFLVQKMAFTLAINNEKECTDSTILL